MGKFGGSHFAPFNPGIFATASASVFISCLCYFKPKDGIFFTAAAASAFALLRRDKAGWLYGFTFNFSAAASLRWLVSKVRNSRAPKCNAVATWSRSKLRCPPAMVWRLEMVSARR